MITKYRGLEMRRLPLIGLILLYPGWLAGQGAPLSAKVAVFDRAGYFDLVAQGLSFRRAGDGCKPLAIEALAGKPLPR
jgi:hypothetical protein